MTRKLINFSSRLIDYIVLIVLLIVLAYGVYSIYSSYAILNKARLPDDIKHLKPTLDDTQNKIKQLKSYDQNIFAWIQLDGTLIDFPVVQGKDNLEYLRKDYNGNYSVSGSIFLDSRNARDFSDSYSIFYGHHMNSSAMFGDLDKYKDKPFFDTNTSGRIFLEDRTYELDIFAIAIVSSRDDNVFYLDKAYNVTLQSRLDYIKNVSLYYRDINIDENSKIVALSTCNGTASTDRIVVYAKLV